MVEVHQSAERQAWDDLARSAHEYESARARFFGGDPVPILKQELASVEPTPKRARLAVRVLVEFGVTRPDVVEALIPELFEWACSPFSARSEQLRQVMCRLDKAVLEERLTPLVDAFLLDQGREASDFVGIVMLLDRADLPDLADRVVNAARTSQDPEMQDIVRTWPRVRDAGDPSQSLRTTEG